MTMKAIYKLTVNLWPWIMGIYDDIKRFITGDNSSSPD